LRAMTDEGMSGAEWLRSGSAYVRDMAGLRSAKKCATYRTIGAICSLDPLIRPRFARPPSPARGRAVRGVHERFNELARMPANQGNIENFLVFSGCRDSEIESGACVHPYHFFFETNRPLDRRLFEAIVQRHDATPMTSRPAGIICLRLFSLSSGSRQPSGVEAGWNANSQHHYHWGAARCPPRRSATPTNAAGRSLSRGFRSRWRPARSPIPQRGCHSSV